MDMEEDRSMIPFADTMESSFWNSIVRRSHPMWRNAIIFKFTIIQFNHPIIRKKNVHYDAYKKVEWFFFDGDYWVCMTSLKMILQKVKKESSGIFFGFGWWCILCVCVLCAKHQISKTLIISFIVQHRVHLRHIREWSSDGSTGTWPLNITYHCRQKLTIVSKKKKRITKDVRAKRWWWRVRTRTWTWKWRGRARDAVHSRWSWRRWRAQLRALYSLKGKSDQIWGGNWDGERRSYTSLEKGKEGPTDGDWRRMIICLCLKVSGVDASGALASRHNTESRTLVNARVHRHCVCCRLGGRCRSSLIRLITLAGHLLQPATVDLEVVLQLE